MSLPNSGIQQRSAHLTHEQMHSYRNKTLGTEELASAGQHLGDCADCRRALRSVMGRIELPQDLAAVPEPLHLTYEEITRYMDGTAGAPNRARAEAHMFLCSSCSRELEDLRRLDSRLSAPAAERTAPRAERVSMRQRLAQFFAVPGRIPQVGFACASIVAGLALLYQTDIFPESDSRVGNMVQAIRSGAEIHPGFKLGGVLLVGLGLAYLLYTLLKKR